MEMQEEYREPRPFLELIDILEVENQEEDAKADSADATINPNYNDNRRLFQRRLADFSWNPELPYDKQPNMLSQHGPVPLEFPGHFYEVEGGVVLIYWESDRSVGCIGTIIEVDEIKETFKYRVYGWQGKTRQTWHTTGSDLVAAANKVWRMVHRVEFEEQIQPKEIRAGQTVRLGLHEMALDRTGYVSKVENNKVHMKISTGLYRGKEIVVELKKIENATEICSCPLFYGLKRTVDGEMGKEKVENLKWFSDQKEDAPAFSNREKPKMLLRAPDDCRSKRVWHLFSIFPKKEFKYCTDVALQEAYDPKVQLLSVTAFLGAWFTKCRLSLGIKTCYSKVLPQLSQTSSGQAFGKIPRKVWEQWRTCVRGYLPIDRELFLGSLLGARNREFGVCRLKSKVLQNSRSAREPPLKIAIDEQLVHYTGSKSGLKKRMPKKTGEGIEYYTIATSNKDYFGYKSEIRELSDDGKPGKLLEKGDPVAGGYKLAYFMEGGARYEVGSTGPSKSLGLVMLLIFSCGLYLRYENVCLVTDSAYGFLEGMAFIGL